jgi:hypothetical protein
MVDAAPIGRMNIAQTLTKALDAITTPRPPLNHLLYEWVVEHSREVAATADELRDARAAQAKWEKAFQCSCAYSERGAKDLYARQLIDDSKDHLDPLVRTRGLESLISEFSAKQQIAKNEMRAAGQEAARVLNAVLNRVRPAAVALLKEREAAEQAEAARFGLVRVPAAATTALAEFANSLRPQDTVGKPSDVFFFLDL